MNSLSAVTRGARREKRRANGKGMIIPWVPKKKKNKEKIIRKCDCKDKTSNNKNIIIETKTRIDILKQQIDG
jgi:hypothetical protein